jgi:hypothetical protein
LLVFLAYLAGPAPEKHDPRETPPLASLCRLPFLRFVEAVYPTAEAADQARWAGRLTGASWTGAAVAVTFEALRTLAPWSAALGLSLLAGFASPLWSWASRTDTLEAPAALAVALLLWLAVSRRAATGMPAPANGLVAGALASFLWGADPSLGVMTPLAILAGVRGKPWAGRDALFAVTGSAAAALGVWRLGRTPAALPRFATFDAAAFAAYLVSPGRGLFLFAPIAALAAAALFRRDGPRRLVRGAAVASLLALVQVACLADPWGPQAFGPALLAPCMPLFAVMACGLPTAGIRAGLLLALPAALANATAVFQGGYPWEARRQPAAHPEAVFDLRDSAFRDLLLGAPTPDPALFLPGAFSMLPGEYATQAGQSLPWLAFGWEPPEATGTWASGRESWIVLAVPPGDYALTLTAAAPRVRGRSQRLEVERPGGAPVQAELTGGPWDFQPISIGFRPEAGITVLKIHPRHTWSPGRGDVRRLSLFVSTLRLQRLRD